MRAIVIRAYGGPAMLEPAMLPPPVPTAAQTLVRVRAAAVNPADGKWRAGMFAAFAPVPFPHILGYDIAGEVIGGAHWPAGTRVFGMLDPFVKGGYAEQAVIDPGSLAAIPDGMDMAQAAAIPTAGLSGLQMVETLLDVAPGQRILITGAVGAVGRFAVHAAKARGAIVVAAVRADQRDAALAAGADDVVILGSATTTTITDRYDHVIDTVGGAAVAALCRALAPGGRIVTAATTPIPAGGLAAQPEAFAVRPDGAQLARLATIVASGALSVPVARIVPLVDAAAAQVLVERGGQGGKIVLRP